jgi:hypothetical protein
MFLSHPSYRNYSINSEQFIYNLLYDT